MPTPSDIAAELADLAWRETDFLGDLTPAADLEHLVANAIDQAADIYADRLGDTCPSIPLAVLLCARKLLTARANGELAAREQAAADALADAIEAGDLDRDCNFIPYPRYP